MIEASVLGSNLLLDSHVDDEIAACLNPTTPRSFFLFAGAGSGKTRSLVNALLHIERNYGSRLRLRGQQVGVITYTNAACAEINSRVEFSSLVNVSTIHSFAWQLIGNFNADIRTWLRTNLGKDIVDLEALEAKGRPGTKASITRQAQIESKRQRIARLNEIKKFIYNPTGDNKEKNSLSHTEVIEICAAFLATKPRMQSILVSHYPFLLIDESQDTNRQLVDAFLAVEANHRQRFCLGLFGDSMQRIYNDGKINIEGELPNEWAKPEKRLNHRCPKRIVRLINRIRSEVDDHQQEARSDSPEGWVRFFVFPAATDDKPASEDAVRHYMGKVTGDGGWGDSDTCKILTLEHHMAAKRMGFQNLFEPLYNVEDFRIGLLDGKLPATRLFTHHVLPLTKARGDKFLTARIVRDASPILSPEALKESVEPRAQLRRAKDAVENLMALWEKGEPTCGTVLENIAASELFVISDSLKPLLALKQKHISGAESNFDPETDQLPETLAALEKFLEAPFSEVLPYSQYIEDIASFDTHQGVKGLEFQRVMVLMDDTEARGFLFGYDKFFGAQERSASDIKNEREGKETVLDRTRRLFYVTCSRAQASLALVMYSTNPEAVRSHVLKSDWFNQDEVVLRL